MHLLRHASSHTPWSIYFHSAVESPSASHHSTANNQTPSGSLGRASKVPSSLPGSRASPGPSDVHPLEAPGSGQPSPETSRIVRSKVGCYASDVLMRMIFSKNLVYCDPCEAYRNDWRKHTHPVEPLSHEIETTKSMSISAYSPMMHCRARTTSIGPKAFKR